MKQQRAQRARLGSCLAALLWFSSPPLLAQVMSAPAAPAVQRQDAARFSVVAQRALLSHPDIQSRRSAFEAQGRSLSAASAAFRPRVDFAANAGTERSARADSFGGSVTETGSSRRATLSLRQPIYDGSEVSSETERQARLGNVRYFELRQAEDVLLLEMARAWIDIERQRTLIEIAQANVAAHEKLVALVRTRVNAGVGKGADLDQAQGRLASAQLVLASDVGALGEASARFQRSALIPAPTHLGPLQMAASTLPASQADALALAVAAAPSLRSAAENGAAIHAELRVRQSAFWPRVALEGRHDLNARTPVLRDAATSSVFLTFNYNLYAGGGDAAREQDAVLRLTAAHQQFQDALVGLRQNVFTSWSEAVRQLTMNQNAGAYADAVARTRDAYRVQYDIGQRSLLDLLNTENELAQAKRQETNSRADALQAQVRLMALAGRLHSALGMTRNEAQPYLPPVADPVDSRQFLAQGASQVLNPGASMAPSPGASQTPNPGEFSAAAPTALNAVPGEPTLGSVLPPSALLPGAAAAGSGDPVPTSRREAPVAAAATQTSGRRPAQSGADPSERPALIAGRFAPGIVLRLPLELNRTFSSWLAALESGAGDSQALAYQSAQLRPSAWDPAGTGRPARGKRVRLLQAEHIDDDRFFTTNSAQIAILAAIDDGGGTRCVRSAQIWRKSDAGPDRWHIARERAINLPSSSCRKG